MFNIDEKSIIRMYKDITPNRKDAIIKLSAVLPYVEQEEIKRVIISAREKISKISDTDFNNLDLSDTLSADQIF